jgi:hypothetical protein
MSPAKEQILNDMEPYVKRVLDSDDSEARKELRRLNEDMQKLNKQENEDRASQQVPLIRISDRTLPLGSIKKAGERRRKQLEILDDSNQDAKAVEDARYELNRLQQSFRETLEDMQLPLRWVYKVPNTTAPSATSQRSSARNRQISNPPTAADSSIDQSPSDDNHLGSTDNRSARPLFGKRNRDVALGTPRESHRPTGTLPDIIRDEQRRTGAAAGEQAVTQEELGALVQLVQQFAVEIGLNQGTQAARQ